MPWFRLEESFHSHPKVLKAGNASTGLWVRCATWSANQLTDGRIPVDVARTLGSRREINTATEAGLWLPIDEELVIPDWLEYQPSALEVKERRKRDAERKKMERERAAGAAVRRGTVVNDPTTGRFRRS